MSESDWFGAPCELLSAPSAIVGRSYAEPRRARRPPALSSSYAPQPAPPPKKTKSTSKSSTTGAGNIMMPDRAADLPDAVHLRHGRYLKNGQVVAVPQLVKDWEEELQDDNNELLAVELAAPGGAWFEDEEVSFVRVEVEGGSHRLLPIGPLRDHVRGNVRLLARPVGSLRKLNVPCRLPRAPLHVVALLSMSDVVHLLVSDEDRAITEAAKS